MAQRIIGLDVGSWSLKAMVLESSLRKVSLVGFREQPIPVDATGQPLPGELPGAVRTILADLDIDVLVTAVPGVQVLTREIKLPFSDEKRIAPIIGFQLEAQIPRPLDTVVYDWHVLRKDPDGALLLCPATEKTWLENWLAELKAGGADPRYVTLSALALAHVLPHMTIEAADRPWVIIDLGHRSTQITLIRAGKVETFRTLARGGHHVTQGIARALGTTYPEAEAVKHNELTLGAEGAQHRAFRPAGQALEPLFREIKLTLDAFAERVQGPLAEVVLIGGTSKLAGIDRLLERMLDMPVTRPRLHGTMWDEVRRRADVPESGLNATALALEHVSDDRHPVNFRRGSLGIVGDFGALRARAGWIAAFVAALLAIFLVRKVLRVSALNDEQTQLAQRLDDYTDKVLGTKIGDDDIPARFDQAKDLVLTPPESETDQVYPSMTAFKIFYDITAIQKQLNDSAKVATADDDNGGGAKPPGAAPAVPGTPPIPGAPGTPTPTAAAAAASADAAAVAEKKQIELTQISVDLKSATVGGSGYDIATVEDFAQRLRAHPCFKKVESNDKKKRVNTPTHNGWLDFTFKIDVHCDKPLGSPETTASAAGTGAAPDKTDKDAVGGKAGTDKDAAGKAGADKTDKTDKAGDADDAAPTKPARRPKVDTGDKTDGAGAGGGE